MAKLLNHFLSGKTVSKISNFGWFGLWKKGQMATMVCMSIIITRMWKNEATFFYLKFDKKKLDYRSSFESFWKWGPLLSLNLFKKNVTFLFEKNIFITFFNFPFLFSQWATIKKSFFLSSENRFKFLPEKSEIF